MVVLKLWDTPGLSSTEGYVGLGVGIRGRGGRWPTGNRAFGPETIGERETGLTLMLHSWGLLEEGSSGVDERCILERVVLVDRGKLPSGRKALSIISPHPPKRLDTECLVSVEIPLCESSQGEKKGLEGGDSSICVPARQRHKMSTGLQSQGHLNSDSLLQW